MTDTKDTNPKDAFGSAKVPMGLAPDTALVEMALAFLEGALKYGRYNWRVVGVRASTYNDAIDRHRKKWWNGQDRDPSTKVRELASVMACCAILIDSEICGVLEDDRPPIAPVGLLLDDRMEIVAHLKELFKDHNPPQYTWEDSPGLQCQDEGCPHYGTPHGHTTATNEATVEPEGFPGGYEVKPGDTFPADGPEHDPYDNPATDHPDRPSAGLLGMCAVDECYAKRELYSVNCRAHRAQLPPPSVPAPPGPLQLDCGCVKRCKGHADSSPGNYAQERAAGATETADAKFPAAPKEYAACKSAD